MENKEELLEKAQQEASLEAQQLQMKLMLKEPIEIEFGTKKVKLFPLTGRPNLMISKYAASMVEYETTETAELICKVKDNINLQYKVISAGILNDPSWDGWKGLIKVTLFHWIHWRSLRRKYDQSDISEILDNVISKVGVGFFFRNTASVKMMNLMKRKRTSQEMELLEAEQKSEK